MADDAWGAPAAGRTPSPARNRSRSPERRENGDDRGDRGGDRGRPAGGATNIGNNLHVSGLGSRVEERDLEDLFSKYGRVTKVQVMRDPHTKDPRGFGFVTLEDAESASEASRSLNGVELHGKRITVEMARRGRARTPTPGAYHGPPKREFDTRGGGGGYGGRDDRRYDDRRGGDPYDRRDRYDDRRDRYDDRRGGYDDRRRDDRGYGGSSYAAPMRDDRGPPPAARYDDRDRRGGYEDDYRGSRY